MRIWYVNHYAIPKSDSLGGRAQYLADSLKRNGHDVTIFGASSHHLLLSSASASVGATEEDLAGNQFHRVAVPEYRGNGISRLRNMLAFGRSLKKTLAAAQNRNEGPNVIIVSSPHPWAWKPLYNVNRGRAKMIFEERDIWPQSLVELAGVPYWHPLILLMNRTMRNIYSTADAIVSLFPCAKQFYIEQNVPDERIHYVSNGIDPDLWDKRTDIVLPGEIANAFSHARNMGKVVVLYAGAMGPPNALDNLLDLEKITPVDRPYHIFLMGDGVSKRDLEARVRSRKIDFVTFLPRVERHIAWAAMKAADILYVGMKKIELYRYGVSPNKVFDYFMAGRPIIQAFVAGNRPVFDAKAGFEADPGNPASIDDAFRRLWAMTPAERDRLGINGRNYVLANHNWQLLGDKYARLCEQVAAEH